MWLADVKNKARRKNQILFSKDCILLADLRKLTEQANHRLQILWALELAEESARVLAEKYPEDFRPKESVEAATSWANGQIKMPIAKQAILNCHAMAKELEKPADIARCHAVGQACSAVHTVGHAMGYPMYELTAIVLEHGLDDCRDPVEQRVTYYEQRLRYWMEYEKTCQQNWAGFLKK